MGLIDRNSTVDLFGRPVFAIWPDLHNGSVRPAHIHDESSNGSQLCRECESLLIEEGARFGDNSDKVPRRDEVRRLLEPSSSP